MIADYRYATNWDSKIGVPKPSDFEGNKKISLHFKYSSKLSTNPGLRSTLSFNLRFSIFSVVGKNNLCFLVLMDQLKSI